MTRNVKIYSHLLVSFALIPALIYGGITLKAIILLYAVYLVLLKDSAYLPALIVLASYMTNAFPLYFAMIGLSALNFKLYRKYRLQTILVMLMIFLPVAVYYSTLQIITFNQKAGLAIGQFQFYLSMFAFFYGILISKSFDNRTIKALGITFFLLYFVNVLTKQLAEVSTVRLIFFIIPFFFAGLIYLLIQRKINLTITLIIIAISAVLLTFDIGNATFTIVFLVVFSSVIVYLYLRNRIHFVSRLTGVGMYFVMGIAIVLAIVLHQRYGERSDRFDVMQEANPLKEFSSRLQTKYFEDRGALWASSWEQIKREKNWQPPINIKKINLHLGSGRSKELEYHSHNVFLELLRSNGIIMGFIVSIILIIISLRARKVFEIKDLNPYFIIMASVSIAGLLIGTMTGIYPLLPSFAICGLGIPGIAYGLYCELNDNSIETIE